MRSADPESVTGLTATIGLAAGTGITAARPMAAWSRPRTIPVSLVARAAEAVSAVTGSLGRWFAAGNRCGDAVGLQ
jgi:NADPH-dependent curcumin reductase CurA